LMQVAGLTQSLLLSQTTLQAALAHMEGAQLMGVPTWQVPLPSQLEAGTSPLPEHEALPQEVPALNFEQPPRPLQVPSCPQVSGAIFLQMAWGSETP
jgi:hypothetical protein